MSMFVIKLEILKKYKNLWYYGYGDDMDYIFLYEIVNDIKEEIESTKLKLFLIRK